MIKLNNGYNIPNLCLGTGLVWNCRCYGDSELKRLYHEKKYCIRNFFYDKKQLCIDVSFAEVVKTAIDNGCKLFDTSSAYWGAEYYLGKALRKYDRSQYFICDKVKNHDQYSGQVRQAFEKSLHELGLEYLDIYLLHWPVTGHYLESWKELERLYEEGLVKVIGVSNCNIHHLKEIENIANINPMINEFECHPLFTQDDLRGYCKKNNIQVMAYTSTARNDERLKKTVINLLAQKYNCSLSQIILRWHQQLGNIPIVNTSNKKHMKSNCKLDFTLTKNELEAISKSNINSRLRYDPDNCDFRLL